MASAFDDILGAPVETGKSAFDDLLPAKQTASAFDELLGDRQPASQEPSAFNDILDGTAQEQQGNVGQQVGRELENVEPLPVIPSGKAEQKVGVGEALRLRSTAESGQELGVAGSIERGVEFGLPQIRTKYQDKVLQSLARGEVSDGALSFQAFRAGMNPPLMQSPLKDWDASEGQKILDPVERKQARKEFVQTLATEVLKERLQNRTQAGTELEARGQTIPAKMVAGGVENLGYTEQFIVNPLVAVVGSSTGRFGELSADKLAVTPEGKLAVTAKADTLIPAVGKAIVGGGVETGIEIKGGDVFNAVLGGALARVPGGKALATLITKTPIVGKTIKKFGEFTKTTGMHGIFGEVFEEYGQNMADIGLGLGLRGSEKLDTNAIDRAKQATKDFDPLEIALSMILQIGGQGGVALAQSTEAYVQEKNRLDKLLPIFGVSDATLKTMSHEDKVATFDAIKENIPVELAQEMLGKLNARAQGKEFGITEKVIDPVKLSEAKVKYISDVSRRMAQDVPIQVFDTEADMVAKYPEIAQANGYKQGAISGVWHDGKVNIVLEKMQTPNDIVSTISHEVGVHAALDRFLTPAEKTMMLKNLGGAKYKQILEKQKALGLSDELTTEETLAVMREESGANPSAYQRAIATVRGKIRQVFPKMKMNDAEIEVLFKNAQEAVTGEGGSFTRIEDTGKAAEPAVAPVVNAQVPAPADVQTPATPVENVVDLPAPQTPVVPSTGTGTLTAKDTSGTDAGAETLSAVAEPEVVKKSTDVAPFPIEGVKWNGVQRIEGMEDQQVWTDAETGGTFYMPANATAEDVTAYRDGVRKKFADAKAVAEKGKDVAPPAEDGKAAELMTPEVIQRVQALAKTPANKRDATEVKWAQDLFAAVTEDLRKNPVKENIANKRLAPFGYSLGQIKDPLSPKQRSQVEAIGSQYAETQRKVKAQEPLTMDDIGRLGDPAEGKVLDQNNIIVATGIKREDRVEWKDEITGKRYTGTYKGRSSIAPDSDRTVSVRIDALGGRSWEVEVDPRILKPLETKETAPRAKKETPAPAEEAKVTVEKAEEKPVEQMNPEERKAAVSELGALTARWNEGGEDALSPDEQRRMNALEDILRPPKQRGAQILGAFDTYKDVLRKIYGKGTSVATQGSGRTAPSPDWELAGLYHVFFINNALDAKSPVNASAIETYGVKLPQGYVKEGELYVFKPITPPAPAPVAPQPAKEGEGQVDRNTITGDKVLVENSSINKSGKLELRGSNSYSIGAPLKTVFSFFRDNAKSQSTVAFLKAIEPSIKINAAYFNMRDMEDDSRYDNKQALTVYDKKTGEITGIFAPHGTFSEDSFIHEITHVATVYASSELAKPHQQKAITELKSILETHSNSIRKIALKNGVDAEDISHALSSVDELMATTIGNEKFRLSLNGIRTKDRTLLNVIIDAIKKVFGVKQGTVGEQVFERTMLIAIRAEGEGQVVKKPTAKAKPGIIPAPKENLTPQQRMVNATKRPAVFTSTSPENGKQVKRSAISMVKIEPDPSMNGKSVISEMWKAKKHDIGDLITWDDAAKKTRMDVGSIASSMKAVQLINPNILVFDIDRMGNNIGFHIKDIKAFDKVQPAPDKAVVVPKQTPVETPAVAKPMGKTREKTAKKEAESLASEKAGFTIAKGKQVELAIAQNGKRYTKPITVRVKQVIDAENVGILYRPIGKTVAVYEIVNVNRLQATAQQEGVSRYHEQMNALPKDERAKVKADNNELNALLGQIDEVNDVSESSKIGASPSKRLNRIAESNYRKFQLSKAANLVGMKIDDTDYSQRASLLEPLKKWVAENKAVVPADKAVADAKSVEPIKVGGGEFFDNDLVFTDGEWYRVDRVEDTAFLIDGETIPVKTGDVIEINGVLSKGDVGYDKALEEYNAQEAKGGKVAGKETGTFDEDVIDEDMGTVEDIGAKLPVGIVPSMGNIAEAPRPALELEAQAPKPAVSRKKPVGISKKLIADDILDKAGVAQDFELVGKKADVALSIADKKAEADAIDKARLDKIAQDKAQPKLRFGEKAKAVPILPNDLSSNQINVLKSLQDIRFDINRLAGPANKETRQKIYQMWTGEKLPSAKTGITALEEAIYQTVPFPKTIDTTASKQEYFKNWSTIQLFKSEGGKDTGILDKWTSMKSRIKGSFHAVKVGDFYEFMFQDADYLSYILDVPVTKRNGVPIVAFPYHALDKMIAKIEKDGAGFDVAVVNDINGDVIPIDTPTADKTRFRITPAEDAAYMDAVERGDTETAQSMVDEAAKKAGYNPSYLVWRGGASINVLKTANELADENADAPEAGNLGHGIYFTPDPTYAKRFGPIRKFYLKATPVDVQTDEVQAFIKEMVADSEEFGEYIDNATIADAILKEFGGDSLTGEGVGGLSYGAAEIATQNSWQSKLADPITRDDAGNIIPLSKRFNDQSDDIRFRRAQTDTPAFRAWFKDSKVVDADGKPLVVYHGTKRDFTVFKPAYNDGLIFFSTNPEFASKWPVGTDSDGGLRTPPAGVEDEKKKLEKIENDLYAKHLGGKKYEWSTPEGIAAYDADSKKREEEMIALTGFKSSYEYESNAGIRLYPVYLSIQNPFDPRKDFSVIEDFLNKNGKDEIVKRGNHKNGNWLVYENKSVVDELKRIGYDGLWLTETVNGPHETIAAFSPNQIKSATANVGTFDAGNPDIRFRTAGNDNPIIAAAYKHPNGKIYTGASHMEADMQAEKDGVEVLDDMAGFVTKEGDFLTRKEAYEHAKVTKQLAVKPEDMDFPEQLQATDYIDPVQDAEKYRQGNLTRFRTVSDKRVTDADILAAGRNKDISDLVYQWWEDRQGVSDDLRSYGSRSEQYRPPPENFDYMSRAKQREFVLWLRENNVPDVRLTEAQDHFDQVKSLFVGVDEKFRAGKVSKNEFLQSKKAMDEAQAELLDAIKAYSEETGGDQPMFRRADGSLTPAEEFQQEAKKYTKGKYVQVPTSPELDIAEKQFFENLAYAEGRTPQDLTDMRNQAEAQYLNDPKNFIDEAIAGKYGNTPADEAKLRLAQEKLWETRVGKDATADDVMKALKVSHDYNVKGSEASALLNLRKNKFLTPESRKALLNQSIFEAPGDIQDLIEKVAKQQLTPAENEKLTKWANKRLAVRKQLLGKKVKDPTTGKMVNVDIDSFTDEQLMDDKFMRTIFQEISTTKATTEDKFFEFWLNSILSGPVTLTVVNPGGNLASFALNLGLGRLVERGLGVATGAKLAPTKRSTRAMYASIFNKETLANAKKVFKEVYNTEQEVMGPKSRKLDVRGGALGGRFGKEWRNPMRILSATDQWFRAMFTPAITADYATRNFDVLAEQGAFNKMLKEGKNLDQIYSAYMKSATDIGSKAYQLAEEEVTEALFQKPLKGTGLPKAIINMRSSESMAVRLLSKYLFPFLTTPTNIFLTALRKSPAGMIPLVGKFAKGEFSGNETAKAEGVRLAAEQVIALSALYAVFAMLKDDDDDPDKLPRMTGNTQQVYGQSNAGQREFEKTNLPAMSIRIGETWYSYSRIEPIATILATLIDSANMLLDIKHGRAQEVPNKAWRTVVGALTNRTYLKTVNDVITVAQEGDIKKADRILTGILSGFVPNVARSAMRATDPFVRGQAQPQEGEPWVEKVAKETLRSAVPVSAFANEPQYDIAGKPKMKVAKFGEKIDPVLRFISPFRSQSATKATKVDMMLRRYIEQNNPEKPWMPSRPEMPEIKPFGGKKAIKLTDAEYSKFQQMAGEFADERLRNRKFNFSNPTERDVDVVKKIYEIAHSVAKARIMQDVLKRARVETTK